MSALYRRLLIIVVVLLLPSTLLATQVPPAQSVAKKPVATRPTAPKPMTNADVMKMTKAGLGEDVVVASIRKASRTTFDTSVDAMIALKGDGVSDTVIAAMMDPKGTSAPAPVAPVAAPTPTKAPEPPKPVITELVVPDGTEVKLRLTKSVSSATANIDDKINLEAVEDVVVNGQVIVAKGASATGTVTEANKKKSFGRQGKLNFTIDFVKSIDGQTIRLRSSKKVQGNESYAKAGVVTILAGPFGALVKGKDVDIAVGTEYTIYIDGDRRVTLAPPTVASR